MPLDYKRLQTLAGRLLGANDNTLAGLSKAIFTYIERETTKNPKYVSYKNQMPSHVDFKSANGATDGSTWALPDNPDSLAFALFYWIAHGEYYPISLYPVNNFDDMISCFVSDFTPHFVDALNEIVAAEQPVKPDVAEISRGEPQLGDVVIHANNSQVTLQHGGHGNIQTVQFFSGNEMGRQLEDLKRLISDSALEDIDKEDAQVEISRITALSVKNRTPDVLKRIDERLGVVSSIVARTSGLAAVAAPVIEAIRRILGG